MVILVCVFQCHPIAFVWNKSIPGSCINSCLFLTIKSGLNVLTDFAILVMPLPAVLGLQLSHFQKVSLVGIFLLGSL